MFGMVLDEWDELAEEEERECGSAGGDGEGAVRNSVGEFEKGLPSVDGESGPLGEVREEPDAGSTKELELDALE